MNTLFIWEFKKDQEFKRSVWIKYYAFDEIFGFLGGNYSLILLFMSYIFGPYADFEFITKNSTKKEELDMHIGQAMHG